MDLTTLFSKYCRSLPPYQELGPKRVDTRYEWPRKGKLLELPEWFNSDPLSGSSFQRNVRLKQLGPHLWKSLDHFRLANWIVNDWGGIRGNKKETIIDFVAQIEGGNLPHEIKGVATYSKILGLIFPDTFCIYDARVAVSLNCIQLIENAGSSGQIFPYLPSRNTKINPFRKRFAPRFLSELGWQPISPDDCYETYNRLLKQLCDTHGIEHRFLLEMALFIDCEELIHLVYNQTALTS